MKISDIYKAIDKIAPFNLQEKWDNSGLLIGDKNTEVTKCLLALDVTPSVIDEAKKLGANLIITHHPVIFDGIKNICSGSLPFQLISSGIAVISAHTNLDMADKGVNTTLAKIINLTNLSPLTVSKKLSSYVLTVHVPKSHAQAVREALTLSGAGALENYRNCSFTIEGEGRFTPIEGANPYSGEIDSDFLADELRMEFICKSDKLPNALTALKSTHPYEVPSYFITENLSYFDEIPLGLVGELNTPITASQLSKSLQKVTGGVIKITNPEKIVKKISICGGSGSSLLASVLKNGSDAFISAEFKHNHFVDSLNSGIALIDAGHYNTEMPVLKILCDELKKQCSDVEFIVSLTGDVCDYYML